MRMCKCADKKMGKCAVIFCSNSHINVCIPKFTHLHSKNLHICTSAHLHIMLHICTFIMKAFYGDLKLGILGGGQLGRMLIQQAINYNVTVKVLDPDREAPCRKLCDEFVVGSLGDYETVYKFGKKVDLLTIEIEKVNVDALEQLEKEGVLVYPQPRIIRLIQDKGLQKQFFKENDIQTAEFQVFASPEQLSQSHIPMR